MLLWQIVLLSHTNEAPMLLARSFQVQMIALPTIVPSNLVHKMKVKAISNVPAQNSTMQTFRTDRNPHSKPNWRVINKPFADNPIHIVVEPYDEESNKNNTKSKSIMSLKGASHVDREPHLAAQQLSPLVHLCRLYEHLDLPASNESGPQYTYRYRHVRVIHAPDRRHLCDNDTQRRKCSRRSTAACFISIAAKQCASYSHISYSQVLVWHNVYGGMTFWILWFEQMRERDTWVTYFRNDPILSKIVRIVFLVGVPSSFTNRSQSDEFQHQLSDEINQHRRRGRHVHEHHAEAAHTVQLRAQRSGVLSNARLVCATYLSRTTTCSWTREALWSVYMNWTPFAKGRRTPSSTATSTMIVCFNHSICWFAEFGVTRTKLNLNTRL